MPTAEIGGFVARPGPSEMENDVKVAAPRSNLPVDAMRALPIDGPTRRGDRAAGGRVSVTSRHQFGRFII